MEKGAALCVLVDSRGPEADDADNWFAEGGGGGAGGGGASPEENCMLTGASSPMLEVCERKAGVRVRTGHQVPYHRPACRDVSDVCAL